MAYAVPTLKSKKELISFVSLHPAAPQYHNTAKQQSKNAIAALADWMSARQLGNNVGHWPSTPNDDDEIDDKDKTTKRKTQNAEHKTRQQKIPKVSVLLVPC